MNQVSFFTPVTFAHENKTLSEKIFENVEGYLSLGSRKAIISEGHVQFHEEKSPFYKTAAKVISYATVILPLIALIAKAIMRFSYKINSITDVSSDISSNVSKAKGEVSKAAKSAQESAAKTKRSVMDKLRGKNKEADETAAVKKKEAEQAAKQAKQRIRPAAKIPARQRSESADASKKRRFMSRLRKSKKTKEKGEKKPDSRAPQSPDQPFFGNLFSSNNTPKTSKN